MKLDCPLSPMSWSPEGAYAVAQGDGSVAPVLIDRRKQICNRLSMTGPIRVLDWDASEDGTFLYVAPDPSGKTSGIYRHSVAGATDWLAAVSSGGAVFNSAGQSIALGNQKLTFRMVTDLPNEPAAAQLAITEPDGSKTTLKALGFQTIAPMLARSTMTYTTAQDAAAIQTFAPAASGSERKIIVYSDRTGAAFLIAHGEDRGDAVMSWSIHGHWLAIADGDATLSTLMVISPPF
jgi:hypothetical protein